MADPCPRSKFGHLWRMIFGGDTTNDVVYECIHCGARRYD